MTNGKADNHEGIDFYKPVSNPDKSKVLWGENQWPGVPGFRDKYEEWVEKMKKLGMVVMEAYVFYDSPLGSLFILKLLTVCLWGWV